MKEEIYILILVSYKDGIRQQNNLLLGTEEECLSEISRLFTERPIYTYESLNTALAAELDDMKETHYWLQKF